MKLTRTTAIRSALAVAFSVATMNTVTACGDAPPPESKTPPAPTTNSVAPVTTTPPAPVETKPAEPTPEEKKKAEAKAELEKDRAKMKSDNESEKARLGAADLKAEAQKLAGKDFASGKAAIQEIAKSKIRKPGNADRDKYRHPAETLELFGFKPTMTVVEYGPGEGWYTELLAPALAKKGKLLATNGDPNGPPDERSTFYAERFKTFLERSPELFGKVETVTVDSKAPNLGHENSVDMVLVMRGLHGMVNANKLDEWLATINKSLKANGVLGIEEHRAPADANPIESAKKGYLPEKWVIEKIEAAGFKLAQKSEMNANPKDTKDYADGVWTLPPTLRLGDKDKEKYLAIGESDRMTLKFTKTAQKPAAAAGAAAPKAGEAPKKDAPKDAPKDPAKK